MNKRMKLAIGAMLAIGMLAGAPVRALGQDVGNQIIPTLELDSADVREALRALFKNVGVSYSIAPEVQGTVTVSLRNVTFEVALRNILGQVNATYRVEGGIYQIVQKEEVGPTPGGGTTEPLPGSGKVIRRLKIRSADPLLIITLLSGSQSTSVAPEQSTIFNTGGGQGQGGQGGGGFGGGGFGGGGGGFGGGRGGGGFGGGGGGRGGF